MPEQAPLVSIVTPVYNGEDFLPECIESILAQSYQNWEYIIVNNCSTDGTPDIALGYAEKDPRISVQHNTTLLPIMENWNHAMRQISAQSRYCKVLHADDWLFPDCLAQMVAVGEQEPSVGIIGSYALWNKRLACDGLPYPSTILSGGEICRLSLLRQAYPFLSPSCLLIRSDLIHNRDPFYSESILHADIEVLYTLLQSSDFGFVHQVLSYVRSHENSTTSTVAKPLNRIILQNLELLVKFGPVFLTEEEYQQELKVRLSEYYKFLANRLFKPGNNDFWDFHKQGLQELGVPLSPVKLRATWVLEVARRILHKLGSKITFTSL